MEKISIFNYEAFYLDFLEGNLNEEDMALFLKFLEENPELKIVDENLTSFDLDKISLDEKTKLSLKQPFLTDTVSSNNIEFFLISMTEGLLEDEKKSEVERFLKLNPEFEEEKTILVNTYFNPNDVFVFNDKASLKRKKAIILWPFIAAAASIILAIVIWNYKDTAVTQTNPLLLVEEVQEQPQEQGETPEIILQENVQMADQIILEPKIPTKKKVENESFKREEEKKPIINIEDRLRPRNPSANLVSLKEEKIKPIHINPVPSEEMTHSNSEQDIASIGFAQMENPIEPITNFLGNKIKTTVDYRRQKTEQGKPSGFFLKIGKLEISRKKN